MKILLKCAVGILFIYVLTLGQVGSARAAAPFSESFDSYSAGSLYSQGLWKTNLHTWQVTAKGCFGNTGKCIVSTGLNGDNMKSGTDQSTGQWRVRFFVQNPFQVSYVGTTIFLGSSAIPFQSDLNILNDTATTNKIVDNRGNVVASGLEQGQWHSLVYTWDMSDPTNCMFLIRTDDGPDINTSPSIGNAANCYYDIFPKHVIGGIVLKNYYVAAGQVILDDIGDGPIIDGCLTNCTDIYSQVTDSFDLFNLKGWTTPESSYNTLTLFGTEASSTGNCHLGNCLIANGGVGGLGTLGSSPRMYLESGVGSEAGAFTIWGRSRIGYRFAVGHIALCTARWSNCFGPYAYTFYDAVAHDDIWHQYYVAWRQGSSTVEACILQDNLDKSNCAWSDTGYMLGTQIDGVQLSASVYRSDLGDQVWFDELKDATRDTFPPIESCTVDCYSNVMFLPGIEASRLYAPGLLGENQIWEPNSIFGNDLKNLDLSNSISNSVYSKPEDVIQSFYGKYSIYKSVFDTLNQEKFAKNINDWTPISYDWQLDYQQLLDSGNILDTNKLYYRGERSATSSPYIIQELKRLASKSKTKKVTIIAHSNGGLLAKALLMQPGVSQYVDKIILVASPQLGTPQAIGGLLHGFKSGLDWPVNFYFGDTDARFVAQNSPSAYNLLPSNNYYTDTDNPVISFDSNSLPDWSAKYSDPVNPTAGIHSVELLKNFMTDQTRATPAYSDLSTPAISSSTLFNKAITVHDKLDTFTLPKGVQIYEIAGWGQPTLAGLKYLKEPVICVPARTPSGCLASIFNDHVTFKPQTTIDGDGTVVVSSALWSNNASTTRYWVNLLNLNSFATTTYNHANIVEVPSVNMLLGSILKNNSSSLPKYISTTKPTYDGSVPRLNFILHSPLTLGFTDTVGKYEGSESTSTSSNVPGVIYKRYGEVQWLSIPKDLAGQIVMRGTGSGSFSLDIEDVNGNDILETTTFAAVPSSTSTVATITIDPNVSPTASSTLAVDYNGDNIVDSTLHAKQGAVVLPDVTPPTTLVSLVGTKGANNWYTSNVQVTFSTTDTESGVDKTFYTIDGFATSTGTTTLLTTEGVHTLTYYSKDFVGNIESATSTIIKIDKTAPEAVISAATSTQDLVVVGTDNLSSTTVTKTGTSTTIIDQAGNKTTLTFAKIYSGKVLTYARLSSIQYGSTPILLSSSFLYVWDAKLTLLSQTVAVNTQFIVQALYDKGKNMTNILVLKKSALIQSARVPGQVILKLGTNNGSINYSW